MDIPVGLVIHDVGRLSVTLLEEDWLFEELRQIHQISELTDPHHPTARRNQFDGDHQSVGPSHDQFLLRGAVGTTSIQFVGRDQHRREHGQEQTGDAKG